MEDGSFTRHPLESRELGIFRKYDSKLVQEIERGAIRLVSAHYMRSGKLSKMQRRQDLEYLHEIRGDEVYITPTAAVQLLFEGKRKIVFLTHGWRTAVHPDPDGETLKSLIAYLKTRMDVLGVFVDFMSLFQWPRNKEQDELFSSALSVMGYGYSSPLGTSVARFGCMPPCPQGRELDVLVLGAAAANRDKVMTALGGPQKCRSVEWIEQNQTWMGHMLSAEDARKAVEDMEDETARVDALPSGARVVLWYNSRVYENRGWCVFESAVSSEVPIRAQFYPNLEAKLARLPTKLVNIGGAQISAFPLPDRAEGAGPRIKAVRSKIIDEEQTKFTGRGDREAVVMMLDRFYIDIHGGFMEASRYEETDKGTYDGQHDRDGRRHGKGTCRYADGSVYEGDWKADQREGKGTLRFADGAVYEGDWKAGRKEGKGTYRFADGAVYEGDWKADNMEGKGTYRLARGGVYEGDWKADRREGKGTYRYADGAVYEGDWKADRFEGRGTYCYADGNVYEGDWKASQRDGKGTFRFADGSVYEGDWKAGQKEGRGTNRYDDGAVYEGDWKAGRFEGRGTLRYADGAVYEGDWKAGRKEGKGTYRYADGAVYEGDWKAGLREGKGTLRSADGSVYEGNWKADQKEGKGTLRSADGSV